MERRFVEVSCRDLDLGKTKLAYIFFPNPTPVFPVLAPLAWSVHKKPIASSRVVTSSSGRATQLACAVYPRWAFTLTYGGNSWLRDQTQNIVPDVTKNGFTELEQISGLFLSCQGSYGEFYYTDPDDSSRSNQIVGTTDGVNSAYQLYYQWGSGPFNPNFYIPVGGINTLDAVYLNGFLQQPNTYTIDATNTKVVFNTVPNSNIAVTASFHFYFRCRFLDDNMNYSQFAQNLWENKEVKFESVKP